MTDDRDRKRLIRQRASSFLRGHSRRPPSNKRRLGLPSRGATWPWESRRAGHNYVTMSMGGLGRGIRRYIGAMMNLTIARVAPLTIGVEEEFFVIDAATGALVPRGGDAVAAARDELGDSVTSELNRSQVEVNSAVCTTLGALGSDLSRLRRRLAAACAPL